MNERIQKLIEQATTIEYGVDNGFDRAFFDKVKFAELIVQECAGLFPNVYVEIETEYGHTPVNAAEYIKKHFGFKE
jgi:hypothetical protein